MPAGPSPEANRKHVEEKVGREQLNVTDIPKQAKYTSASLNWVCGFSAGFS